MNVQFSTPLTLPCGVTLKNRFLKSAMSEQLGDRHHDPTEGLARLYATWAAGGVGVSVTGNVMVDRHALGEPRNVVLDEQSDLESFRRWAEAGQSNGALVFVQLNHPGKQSPRGVSKETVAPSAVPVGGELAPAFGMPRPLGGDEIVALVTRFATSAALAKRAGFSGVQIHASHGYLVSEFLSPHANRREDAWGGSRERRSRFVLDVYAAIRAAVGPSFPVSIKLNSSDFHAGGLTEEESLDVAEALARAGIDLIEISGGTYEAFAMMGTGIAESARPGEGYFLGYAAKLRARVSVPLVVTGGFRSGSAMMAALGSGVADLIGMARPLAVCPDFPNKLLSDPTAAIALPRPSTHVDVIDRFTALDLTWYEAQIARMARGRAPKEHLNAWSAVALFMRRTGTHVLFG